MNTNELTQVAYDFFADNGADVRKGITTKQFMDVVTECEAHIKAEYGVTVEIFIQSRKLIVVQ